MELLVLAGVVVVVAIGAVLWARKHSQKVEALHDKVDAIANTVSTTAETVETTVAAAANTVANTAK
jgi:HAMP domain-containing protein